MSVKKDLFITTLENPFNIERFITFTKEFFNNIEIVRPDKYMDDGWNWSEFSFHVKGYYHIANFLGNDKSKIAVFAVEMKNHKNIDRSRSVQRNFIKKLMVSGGIDGAIVAFYAEGEGKWRLSFIKIDYEFAKGKVTEKMTPAKRYSYLVGEGEPCHTAMERLYPIFINEKTNPTIFDIEEAFSVERVTKEFFESYKEKYFQLKEHLDKNEDFVLEAERLNFTSEQFAKKLMGQLAFLYFIQKKGWLGVNAFPKTMTASEFKKAFFSRGKASRDVMPKAYRQTAEDEYSRIASVIEQLSIDEQEILAASVKGQPWGTGPKNFIRELFKVCHNSGTNFFDDYLEPLFYEALNEKRGANDYYHRLKCRVPFLNGGLFEPIDNYDWNHNDFNIPNEMFSNEHLVGKDDAHGILDIFDRYNFTMNEDEPLEKEVAVDPEMLGKIFENLLDIKDRKSKGAFYTPREIVHYMCQESLINYLVNETGISYDALKDLIVFGEFMKDEDTNHLVKKGVFDMLISKEILNRENGVNRLKEIDEALANIKVADPAVGSGAFPLGMLSEIVKARRNITEYFAMLIENKMQVKMMYESERHPLNLKLHTIKNSIFAVDIEPSAVDITKLRLWLSLVVEQETDENAEDDGIFATSRNPRPLPNLDCNIRCGNSLIDELDGIKLVNDSDLFGEHGKGQMILGQNQYDTLLTQLFEAQDKLFYENNHKSKDELKNKIRAIFDKIIMFGIDKARPQTLQYYNTIKNEPSLPYFLWKLEFAKVFKEKGGFDVVIGNPPYVQLQKFRGNILQDVMKRQNFDVYHSKGDIYCLFYEQGVRLLKETGVLCYITSNKWMRAGYGEKLRGYFIKYNPKMIIDLGSDVFETATVDTNILLIEKSKNSKELRGVTLTEKNVDLSNFFSSNAIEIPDVSSAPWFIGNNSSEAIKKKFDAVGIPLSKWNITIKCGFKTGLNEAFVISQESYEAIVSTDDKSKKIIRKNLRGKDVRKYTCNWGNNWIIVARYGFHKYVDNYPAIKEHLLQYEEKLKNRGQCKYTRGSVENNDFAGQHHWLELDNNPKQDIIDVFESDEKILFPDIAREASFYYDTDKYYTQETCFAIVGENLKYLLAMLNSKLVTYIYKNYYAGGGLGDKAIRYKKAFLEKLPIIKANPLKEKIEQLVDQILLLKKSDIDSDISDIELQIDKLIYEVYDLTSQEIEIVEGGSHG